MHHMFLPLDDGVILPVSLRLGKSRLQSGTSVNIMNGSKTIRGKQKASGITINNPEKSKNNLTTDPGTRFLRAPIFSFSFISLESAAIGG